MSHQQYIHITRNGYQVYAYRPFFSKIRNCKSSNVPTKLTVNIVKKLFFILYILLLPCAAHTQNYAVFLIPDSLLKHANTVKRIEEIKVLVSGLNKAKVNRRVAYTVLNEYGDHFTKIRSFYDEFEKVNELKVKLFDANGKLIRSIKKSEFNDESVYDGYSLALSARVKKYDVNYKQYPFTVELEEENELDGFLRLPLWNPIEDENLSVQESSYKLETPKNYTINIKQFRFKPDFQIDTTTSNQKKYSWSVKNLSSVQTEIQGPGLNELTPLLVIVPQKFEYGNEIGSMQTWNDFGNYFLSLNKNRDQLPINIKTTVHTLTDTVSETKRKIQILYNYLQKNTRYISVQLGIGGLQPFPASYVAENKYGDCKALSNFMVSLLKEVGIQSYYTLIAAGKDNIHKVIPDLPNDYFNHVITCVPNNGDTVWLECTSQTSPPNYMGTFTGNRNAFLITESGGILVQTPSYASIKNEQIRNVKAEIAGNGMLTLNVQTHFSGISYEYPHAIMHQLNQSEKIEYLNTHVNLPTYKLLKCEYSQPQPNLPVIDENLIIQCDNYVIIDSKRIFVALNFFNKTYKYNFSSDRQTPIIIDYTTKNIDSISFKIPQGYEIESLPNSTQIENEFGTYSIDVSNKNNGTIELIITSTLNAGTYDITSYLSYKNFISRKIKLDQSNIVLVKK